MRGTCTSHFCEYWLSWTNTISEQNISETILILKWGPCLVNRTLQSKVLTKLIFGWFRHWKYNVKLQSSARKWFWGINCWNFVCHIYRTWVRSLAMLVSNWLTLSLPFSKLDWCYPSMCRWQLKTCWSCYCCWGWWWETCRQQFGAHLEGELWS